jgi:hypothetical protein
MMLLYAEGRNLVRPGWSEDYRLLELGFAAFSGGALYARDIPRGTFILMTGLSESLCNLEEARVLRLSVVCAASYGILFANYIQSCGLVK